MTEGNVTSAAGAPASAGTEAGRSGDLSAEFVELETSVEKYAEHLRGLSAALKDVPLHFLVRLSPAASGEMRVVVEVANFVEGRVKTVPVEPVPAAFFYEAYRELLPEILERAAVRAENAVQIRAQEHKARIEAARSKLDADEQLLTKYLAVEPQAVPSNGASRKGKRP